MMKKQLLALTLLMSIFAPLPRTKAVCVSCHSGAAVAGGVVGGIAGGLILGLLISKASKKNNDKKPIVKTAKKVKVKKSAVKAKPAPVAKAA